MTSDTMGREGFCPLCRRVCSTLREYIGLEKELLIKWVGDREERDREMLKQFRKIRGRIKRNSQRGLMRTETLRSEMGNVTAR